MLELRIAPPGRVLRLSPLMLGNNCMLAVARD